MTTPVLVHGARPHFAATSWTVEDVLELRPNWTRAEALAFLAKHEDWLRDKLTEHGWFVIEQLLATDPP